MATESYIEATGRRKTSTARARITPSSKSSISINGKKLDEYFKTESQRRNVQAPLSLEQLEQKFAVTILVKGGGIMSQSEAVRHSIARALTKYAADLRSPLKKEGMLTRDPRMKERRKFGLKKARRAAQWSKR